MDFFERQEQARRNTKLLVVYFVAGVASLIVAVYLAALLIFTGVHTGHHRFLAAGHSTSDAVVAVTEGSIKLLSRDELQGVIGHEFSHILNGDMRLNLRLMGVIFGILCLTIIGRILLQTRRSSRDRNPLPLFGL